MPQIFRIGLYVIHFWSNEGLPLEPIHVHISKGKPNAYSTKVWIYKNGECEVDEKDKDKIPSFQLKYIIKIIESNKDDIAEMWIERFGEITYKK